ncbi:ATP synthase subunit I [Bordetella sp. FB-8]|uniref:ATP synthase subunit I n=1 Tax=Bordetella sp. FB-8 TaxID=1159870 RepID=UPI0003768587|nr:ATP synthase subunit I [Bordetella sp. FB-8]
MREENTDIEAEVETPPIVLSIEERLALDAQACRDMLLILAAQAVMGLGAAVLAGVWAGSAAGLSALIGAGAYWFPNAFFALRLLVGVVRSMRANPFAFLLGELAKLLLTVLILGLAAWYARGWLVWPAVLVGLLLTLKGYLPFMLLRKRSRQ